MIHISRRAKIFLSFLAIVIGGYLLASLIRGSNSVPEEFFEARLQGALIAQKIVNLSNQSTEDLKTIGELNTQGRFTEALELTARIADQSREIRDQAIGLSREIEKMTTSLSLVTSIEAREAALESISGRLALISRLINYSGYLGQLLDALRNRFTGSVGNQRVADLITQINVEIEAINGFNDQATRAMEKFDAIIKQ